MAAVLAQARVQAVAWAPVAEAQVLAEGRSLLAEARVEELAARAVELAVELAAVAEAARAAAQAAAQAAASR
jgi:hypothetical protein